MINYVGKKAVKATPMTRAEYNIYRGWELPADENGADEGMLVEYIDGGKSNHPDHVGYISWSPKDVFEKAYKVAETYLDRLCNEIVELSSNLDKLYEFITNNPAFANVDTVEQALLKKQYVAMAQYQQMLVLRPGAYCPPAWLAKALPVEKTPYDRVQVLLNSCIPIFTRVEGTTKTYCDLQMPNGFVIGSGFSACVNPADYNQELGEKYAKERALADAENNLWQCEGYARAMLYTA